MRKKLDLHALVSQKGHIICRGVVLEVRKTVRGVKLSVCQTHLIGTDIHFFDEKTQIYLVLELERLWRNQTWVLRINLTSEVFSYHESGIVTRGK